MQADNTVSSINARDNPMFNKLREKGIKSKSSKQELLQSFDDSICSGLKIDFGGFY